MNSLEFIDKGLGRPLLLLPGWGFHPAVMDHRRLDFDVLLPVRPLLRPLDEIHEVLDLVGLKRLSILGWSLGAKIALEAAASQPELFDWTILVSLPVAMNREVLRRKREEIETDQERALKAFYMAVFEGNASAYRRFKKGMEKRCLSFWPKKSLREGLDILARPLPGTEKIDNLLFVHGRFDHIAPIESLPIPRSDRRQKRLMMDCGHIPFIQPDFYDEINRL